MPIRAYCVPAYTIDTFIGGCVLKVETAAPGAGFVFRIVTSGGAAINITLQPAPESLGEAYFQALPDMLKGHNNVSGTVEYAGWPEETWPLLTENPRTIVSMYHEKPMDEDETCMKTYRMKWLIRNKQPLLFFTYKYVDWPCAYLLAGRRKCRQYPGKPTVPCS